MDNFTAAKLEVNKLIDNRKKDVAPRDECPCQKLIKPSAPLKVEESETGVTVIIGGTEKTGLRQEYVIGGWSEYEINRRHYRSGDYYPGRTYITSEDAIYSILGGSPNQPFKRAAEEFATILDCLKKKHCLFDKNSQNINNTVILICLESEDVRNIAQSTPLIEELNTLSDESTVLAKSFGLHLQDIQPPVIPNIPKVTIGIGDKEKIRNLERKISHHAVILEKYQAKVTSRLLEVSLYLTSFLQAHE